MGDTVLCSAGHFLFPAPYLPVKQPPAIRESSGIQPYSSGGIIVVIRHLLVALLFTLAGLALGFTAFFQNPPQPVEPPPAPPVDVLPGARPGPRVPVASSVIDVAKLASRSSGVGSRRDLFDGPTVTLNNLEGHVTTLKPGAASHPPHQHVTEEIIVLLEGKLEVNVNDRKQVAETGAVLFFASNDLHNVRNVGTVPAVYYVFNWSAPPKPTAK
jgi:quercetin dioxygenase-like cupin family protein